MSSCMDGSDPAKEGPAKYRMEDREYMIDETGSDSGSRENAAPSRTSSKFSYVVT